MTTRILVTGANGQMGQALAALAQPSDLWEWHFVGRDSLDITDEEQVMKYVRFLQPDILINTSAFTAVDQAESDVDAAFLLNRDAVSYLAAASASVDALFIHLSTDYVYDNGQNYPYTETDKVRPHSAYARSKLAGEKEALLLNPDTAILRTSWLYGPVRHNFLQTILRLGREKEVIEVVFDQVGTPTFTRDLAVAIIQILHDIRKNPLLREQFRGVFNFSNEGVASWYDFAEAILRLKGLPCRVSPIRSSQYATPARRPSYSVMDKQKITGTFGLQIPHWMDGLERCLRLMEG
jgi:dTDP-4-dehydrorhamnose reductase